MELAVSVIASLSNAASPSKVFQLMYFEAIDSGRFVVILAYTAVSRKIVSQKR